MRALPRLRRGLQALRGAPLTGPPTPPSPLCPPHSPRYSDGSSNVSELQPVKYRMIDPTAASHVMSGALTAGKWLALPYVSLLLLLVTFQRQIIFPRPAVAADAESTGGDLHYIPSDGVTGKLAVLHFPVVDLKAPTLVYFHGNADQLGWSGAWLGPQFRRRGCAFYAVEYPGYGLSDPPGPDEATLCAAGERAVRFLTDPAPHGLGVDPQKVVLFGQSIGSGVAMHLAAKGLGSRLVLLSAFTSIPEMAQSALLLTRFLPLPLLRYALLDHFDNAAKAPSVTLPTCIIHGDRDEIVPFFMGERLRDLMPHAEFRRLSHTGHNDVFLSDEGAVIRIVTDFAHKMTA